MSFKGNESQIGTGKIDLRVKNSTNTKLLATSIQKNIEEGKTVQLSCIGVQPISQAMKAVAVARGKVSAQGYTIVVEPYFATAYLEDANTQEEVERTVVRFNVYQLPVNDFIQAMKK